MGGPPPWSRSHSSSSLKRRRRQASDGQPIASKTLMFEKSRRLSFKTARATDNWMRFSAMAWGMGQASHTGAAYSREDWILRKLTNKRLTIAAEPERRQRRFKQKILKASFSWTLERWADHDNWSVRVTPRWQVWWSRGNFWTTEDKLGIARFACLTFSNYHLNWFWGVETWAPGISAGM